MVGDSGIDVRTGRAAGALTVGVTYGFDAEQPPRRPARFSRAQPHGTGRPPVVEAVGCLCYPLPVFKASEWRTFSSGARRRDLISGEIPAGIATEEVETLAARPGRRRGQGQHPRPGRPRPPRGREGAARSLGTRGRKPARPHRLRRGAGDAADDLIRRFPFLDDVLIKPLTADAACACAWSGPSTPSTAGA